MRALARSAASISRWVSAVLTGSAGPTGDRSKMALTSAVRRRCVCVDNFAHAFGEREERNDKIPVAAPALCDRWILLAPRTLCEGIEGGLAYLGVGRAIDGPKRLRDVLAILPSGKIHGMADQVNDAGLNDRLRENRIDGFRKALQAIEWLRVMNELKNRGAQDILIAVVGGDRRFR